MFTKQKHNTLLFSVLYPGLSDSIIMDYVDSITNQTDKEFDWLMINDNCGPGQLHLFPHYVTWINLDSTLSFGKIREIGISYAISNEFDNIVFSDIDDYYSENRIELSKLHLQDNAFVFSELQIVNFNKVLMHNDFISNLAVNPIPSHLIAIIDHNYIGLSHSAVRTKALLDFEIPITIDVVDWWLFSLLLIQSQTGKFMPDVSTFYRQNEENYVGVFNLLDTYRLNRGVGVKLIHYGNLLEYCKRNKCSDVADLISTKYQEMVTLKEKISDDTFATEYIRVINSNFSKLYKGWWSEIISLEIWEQL